MGRISANLESDSEDESYGTRRSHQTILTNLSFKRASGPSGSILQDKIFSHASSPEKSRISQGLMSPKSPGTDTSFSKFSFRGPVYNEDDSSSSESETGLEKGKTDDDSDSEEEEFPVNPTGHKKDGRFRMESNAAISQQEERDVMHIYKIASHVDDFDAWSRKRKGESLRTAQQSIMTSLRRHEKSVAESNRLVKERYKQNIEREAEEIRRTLEKIELERSKSDREVKAEFERRNKELWTSIESAISQVQSARNAEIAAENRALEEMRKKQEDQARIAREQKEAAEQRIAMEKEKEAKEQQDRIEAARRAEEMKTRQAQRSLAAQADSASPSALESARKYRERLEYIRTSVLPAVSANQQWKNHCFQTKRQITLKVGQLINRRDVVFKIANELNTIFTQAKAVSDIVGEWILNFAAKAIVKQAETEVRVKQSTAYPLAQVCVLLFMNHPQFFDTLMARFVKKCSYVLPIYMDKTSAQSEDEIHKAMGRKKKEDEWEDDVQYTERMCGMLALWSAITQTTPEVGQNICGISHGWTWLARIVNMPPRKITPALINTFLEVAGPRLQEMYPRQIQKILGLIMQQFILLIPEEAVAAKTRLRNYLDEVGRTGRLKGIEGRNYES